MGSFSPQMLPVFSAIAKGFAVYDAWHSGVPSQTFCNRSFFHASTSHGFVTNKDGGGYDKWIDAPATPTVFNRLEEAGLTWRVYYDTSQMVSFTGMLHAAVLEPYWKTNFRSMDQFYEDVKNGNLPAYSFVEPRMVFNHNDMHPPFGTLKESEYEGQEFYDSALSDVRAGETLLHNIYSALRTAKSAKGSNAMNTAFLVTFDEHGGTFDHVPPPSAVPPTQDAAAGEMNFTFERLGCRVPALLVSAYTAPGSIIHDEMHHGSLIATLNRLHGLSPLTRRDATANNVFNAVNLTTPRQSWEWPVTHPAYTPKNPEDVPKPHDAKHKHRPLSAPAQGLLGLLLAKYEPSLPVPATYGDAYDVLVKHGKGLFGNRD
jgi:phospholipase C